MDQGADDQRGERDRPTDHAPNLPETPELKDRLNQERQRVGLSWPYFAALLDFNQSSLYKIAAGTTARTHMTTKARLVQKLAEVGQMTPEQARAKAKTLPIPEWATRAGRKKKPAA